ncbi:RHTO0S02e13476g1_1 [Rhodotorula toruloides]|uniref:RHTO0S02e13476g1_1 n=1 Tax=Rhodotorula toruloides TaxID=5286 RepID=A0A061AID2_RHOTO|nr:RHTO0S02e13476g1_1 [Rhodotorula toruloides]
MGADKERFTTTLPNHLHCRACVEISYPAVIVCSQGHHLCRPCAEKIEESGELECPLCLRPMKLPLRESLLLRRAVEDYEFTCRHEGCDWIGSVVDEDEHADKCEFGPVACSLCAAVCTRRELSAHHGVCPNVRIPCPKGGDICASRESDGLRN